jgi:hypothetical protein
MNQDLVPDVPRNLTRAQFEYLGALYTEPSKKKARERARVSDMTVRKWRLAPGFRETEDTIVGSSPVYTGNGHANQSSRHQDLAKEIAQYYAPAVLLSTASMALVEPTGIEKDDNVKLRAGATILEYADLKPKAHSLLSPGSDIAEMAIWVRAESKDKESSLYSNSNSSVASIEPPLRGDVVDATYTTPEGSFGPEEGSTRLREASGRHSEPLREPRTAPPSDGEKS